jgi:nitrate reductase gamma subunit
MEETALKQVEESSAQAWKVRTLAVGALLGALTGLGAAYLLVRRVEQRGQPLTLTPAKGLKLGVLLAGVLRSILSWGEE